MTSKPFFALTLLTLSVGVVLIWWGAAVTTEDVGLSVPDWPLAYGKVNPDGWLLEPALLLEHGHRWIGATIGMLVLALYLWQFAKFKPRFIEVTGFVICGLGYLYLVSQRVLGVAMAIALMGLGWVIMTWVTQKWNALRGLTTLALLLVLVQASLGGLRVLEMSDPYGIVHGTLGQVFYCLLVVIAFLAWPGRETSQRKATSAMHRWSIVLWGGVFMQLVFGAILRHTQRDHLAADDILTTGGAWVPSITEADAFMLFLHKYWGFTVALLVFMVARMAWRWHQAGWGFKWLPGALTAMPVLQVLLGITVVMTGKSFWVTNFHVLNGLGLLACATLLTASVWFSRVTVGLPKVQPAPGLEVESHA
jgi:cytochrome c oxidase assembly protein subunit 15